MVSDSFEMGLGNRLQQPPLPFILLFVMLAPLRHAKPCKIESAANTCSPVGGVRECACKYVP